MLRQSRPKSQPPSVKNFNQPPEDDDDDDWNKLVARYKNVSDCKLISSNGSSSNTNKKELGLELESSSASSASSSSSLASSTLSLSTNGSTSTVLAALNSSNDEQPSTQTNGTIRTTTTNNNKSMIARYSATPAATNTSGPTSGVVQQKRAHLSDARGEKEFAKKIPLDEARRDHHSTMTSEEEEEDLNQPLSSTSSSASSTSSTSSSSSSSGLSSMNSANSNGSQSKQQQPYVLPAQIDDGLTNTVVANDNDNDNGSDDIADDDEIGQCLEDLVESVASDNEAAYGTFQLHQALLAKTRSSTSTSSDDETIASTTSNQDQRLNQLPGAGQPPVGQHLTAAAYSVEFLPRDWTQDTCIGGDPTVLVHRARKWVARDDGTRQRKALSWLVGLRPQEFKIEWRSSQPETGASVGLDRVIDCIVTEELVIWILATKQQQQQQQQQQDHSIRYGQAQGGALSTNANGGDELETTLDDIALALDEPISNQKSIQSYHHHEETLVWWCASESEARTFGDTYRILIEQQNNSNRYSSRDIDTDCLAPSDTIVARRDDEPSAENNQNLSERQLPPVDPVDSVQPGPINGIEQMKPGKLSKVVDDYHQSSDGDQVVKQGGSQSRKQTCNGRHRHHHRNQQPVDETPAATAAACSTSKSEIKLSVASLNKLLEVAGDYEQQPSSITTGKPADDNQQHSIESEKTTTSGRDKLNKQAVTKSASTEVTTTSDGGQKQAMLANGNGSLQASPSAQVPGLASYYKSVASKVLSNGQNKIRSFKDEMIKLNNRTQPTSSSSTSSLSSSSSQSQLQSSSSSSSKLASKRVPSMATIQVSGPGSSSTHSTGKKRLQASSIGGGSVLNLSTLDSSTTTKILKSSDEQVANSSAGHQHRPTSMVAAKQPVDGIGGKLQQVVGSCRAATISTDNQIPAVKPRTSILKNRSQPQLQQTNGCDINNNNDNGCNNRMTAVDQFRIQRTSSGNKRNAIEEQQQRCLVSRLVCQENSSKPKSILKSSKSVSNLVAEGQQLYHSTSPSSSRHSKQLQTSGNGNAKSSLVSLNDRMLRGDEPGSGSGRRQYALAAGSSCLDIASAGGQRRSCATSGAGPTDNGAHYYTMRRAPESGHEKKRRSVAPDHLFGSRSQGYTSADVRHHQRDDDRRRPNLQDEEDEEEENDLEDDEDEQEAMNRQQAFERLRQRASCYDITRLMSKNGLQNQLSKLRAGSTNSIAGKSRQRRPALLISDSDNNKYDEEENTAPAAIVKATTMRQTTGRAMMKLAGSTMIQSTSGTASEDTAYSSEVVSAQGGRRHMRQVANNASNASNLNELKVRDNDSGSRSKKSEFDPRSLRGPPVGLGSSSSISVPDGERASTGSKSAKSSEQTIRNHKPMTSIIRLTGANPPTQGNTSRDPKATSDEEEEVQHQQKRVDRDLTSVVSVDNREKKQTDRTGGDDEDEDKNDDDDDDDELTETEAESTEIEAVGAPAKAASGPLSKSGPFSLLRQSFNQKTLSSMLKFSGRASLRMKSTPATVATAAAAAAAAATGGSDKGAGQHEGASDKASAIAVAEANLMAAKQLKQQAQRLKEQHKREQQQQLQLHQQQVPLDPATMMMAAAVQYNQHLQRQQQQQQQQHHHHQLMYQHQAQQYAVAARGQMFDASSMHLQHQMLIHQRHQHQQQQQQHHHHQHQLAYMANLNSTHYMAQQMVMASNPMAAVALGGPMGAAGLPAAAQQLMYGGGPQVASQAAPVQPPPSSSLFRKSILKGSHKPVASNMMNPELVYSQQQQQHHHHHQQQQQLIPMAVNHHSSFNIVYAGAAAPPQMQQSHQLEQQQVHDEHHHPSQKKQANLTPSIKPATKSSLGASMRKTVKSILVNRSAFLSSAPATTGNPALAATKSDATCVQDSGKVVAMTEHKLKSALKSATVAREIALNSEGSDGDGSTSSDSTTVNGGGPITEVTTGTRSLSASITPKSALKKSLKGVIAAPLVLAPSDSSDSSCSSSPSSTDGVASARQTIQYEKIPAKSQLSRGYDHRQSVRINTNSGNHYNSSTLRATKQQRDLSGTGRKNVTFSTKLTSIL